jgi:AraC-like DNA-binding protein
MTIDFNLVIIFLLFVIVQGFTTSILLLKTTAEQKQNLWLGLLILGMTFQTVDSFLINAGIYRDYHWLYFSPLFFSWSYGALFYFYIQYSVNQSFIFQRKHLLNFIPVGIQSIFYLLISVQDLSFKTWFWFNIHKPITRYVDVYIGILLVFIYLYRCHELVKKVNPKLQWFLIALVVFYTIAAIDPLINAWYLPAFSPKFYLIEYILPIFTYWLGLLAYVKEKFKKKPKNSNTEFNQVHLQTIIESVEQNALYLNPELSLSDLANTVDLNVNIVSATLNNGLGQSFNDFINHYRVEAIKHKLQAGEHLKHTLLGIALDCGFNSKNTFNRAFKKSTGLSPKEWIEANGKFS